MIGIVAHIARAKQAHTLRDMVGADYVSMDDGTLGCEGNHRQAWQYLADTDDDWALILEDDAVPVDGFTEQLGMALAAAPTPVVSLYLGTGFPVHHQDGIGLAINNADHADASWITSTHLLHAVGVAMRTDLISQMLDWTAPSIRPADDRISDWAKERHHAVGYTWPSLVDHQDGQTLVDHHDRIPRLQPRRAWKTGTRTHWTSQAVTL